MADFFQWLTFYWKISVLRKISCFWAPIWKNSFSAESSLKTDASNGKYIFCSSNCSRDINQKLLLNKQLHSFFVSFCKCRMQVIFTISSFEQNATNHLSNRPFCDAWVVLKFEEIRLSKIYHSDQCASLWIHYVILLHSSKKVSLRED